MGREQTFFASENASASISLSSRFLCRCASGHSGARRTLPAPCAPTYTHTQAGAASRHTRARARAPAFFAPHAPPHTIMAAPQPPPPVVPVDEDEFEEFEDEGACGKGRVSGLLFPRHRFRFSFSFFHCQPSLSLPSTHTPHHTDWDAGAEAPPDPSLWEADWDDDTVDDAFGQALAGALAQAQQQQPAALQQ